MALKERDVVLTGKSGNDQTMDFPITRLGNIEDTAEVKTSVADGDYIPIIDSQDSNQMKKIAAKKLSSGGGNYLPTAGGRLTGNLRIQPTDSDGEDESYGGKINFGDGEYAYISEPEDDVLEIHAGQLRFTHSGGEYESDNPLPPAWGGTGKNTPLTAQDVGAMRFLGTNIIGSTSEDTTSKWLGLGCGVAFINVTGRLVNQPSQFGLIINIVSETVGTDVFQIWRSQYGTTGPTYWRHGNNSGWSCAWTKVYDTLNKPAASEIGSGTFATTGIYAASGTDYTTARIRNIRAGTSAMTSGSSSLTNGSIYLQYE